MNGYDDTTVHNNIMVSGRVYFLGGDSEGLWKRL